MTSASEPLPVHSKKRTWVPFEELANTSAHRYGNYHKYYTFHSTESRMSMFKSKSESFFENLWRNAGEPNCFTILDIGCNEGLLTRSVLEEAARELPSNVRCHAIGVDIDQTLIDLAVEMSTKRVDQNSRVMENFYRLDFIDTEAVDELIGKLSEEFPSLKDGFTFVSIFSTTMWIHLNFGDEGLRLFIANALKQVSSKGVLIVEPQLNKCYRSAAKRCRKLGMERPAYLDQIKPDQVEDEIKSAVIQQRPDFACTYCLGKESWGRPIYIFAASIFPFLSEYLLQECKQVKDD